MIRYIGRCPGTRLDAHILRITTLRDAARMLSAREIEDFEPGFYLHAQGQPCAPFFNPAPIAESALGPNVEPRVMRVAKAAGRSR